MRRLVTGLLALLFLALSTAGPRPAAAAGELKIGITQFPSTFHPLIDSMLAKSYILAMTLRPVAVYDQDWQLVCLLCTELPTIENGGAVPEELEGGGQGIAITYKLHPDATWGDGTPVTSDDVVFTWEFGKHPQSGVANREPYEIITAIDVIDAKTYRVHVNRLKFDYAQSGSFNLLPAHLERPIFEANPTEYRNRNSFDTDPTNPGLAFGPYKIAEIETGAHVVLEANPTWYGPKPAFDRIRVRVIENTAALEANLLSGAIDMVAGELGLTIDQALAFEKRHADRFDITYKAGLIYEHIDLNLEKNPILQDKRVRHALLHALDREALSEQLFGGKQPVAHASVSPLDWINDPDVRTYPYDPDKAAALLDEAGWSDIRDGVRHNSAGEPLSLEISTTAGNRSRELVQQVLQSQWQEVGVSVPVRNQPARVFFGETVTKRSYGAMAMFAWISAPESVPRSTLHSEQIPTEANNWSGQNYTGFASERMDQVIDRIELELDRAERKLLWKDLQDIYTDDLPVLPLYWRANPYIMPKWLKGIRPTGHLITTTMWVEEWRRE